jgi:hypothetical protein
MGVFQMVEIEQIIVGYERLLEFLGQEIEFVPDDGLQLLLKRDVIEDVWPKLSEEQRKRVVTLDGLLIEKTGMIADAQILPNPNFSDRKRWWWFLHEGPQVREQVGG